VTEPAGQRAFVTGGGRGIGENLARELAAAGMEVAVSGRTAEQVESVAAAIGGRPLVGDVTRPEDVERWFAELGPVDLLVANAGVAGAGDPPWEAGLDDWWRTFEVNVLGVHLCCRAAIPGMLERGAGRIVIVGSGSAYLPGASGNAYASSKAAVCRYGETLANSLRDRIPVFVISPGMVRTEMTSSFPDDMPWTPPECAPRLVRALASGEFDALAGRYLHAEHDPPESLRGRIDEILEHDWNAIRLRRP
jgi:NAD(P)-dependent dehydrogenase (short-subunit alcohol dehydrogenase family)